MRREVGMNLQSAWVRGVRREVLTPRVRPRHLFLMERDAYDQHLFADAGGHGGLAELFAVAATESRRMVYIPKGPEWPDELPWFSADPNRGLAMLFVHHSTQFRPSDWPELRRRLGPARTTRRQGEIRLDREEYLWSVLPTKGDPVDVRLHADTLIVTGSRSAFRQLAETFWGESGLGRHAHVHFQDIVSLRQDRGIRSPMVTPDVVTVGCSRWRDGGPFVPYGYRWLYRPREAENEAKAEMGRDGWTFVRWIDGAMVFRREER
ncbi:MAG: hypothetical protein ACO1SV_18240 [Fimbriimonas sp.]